MVISAQQKTKTDFPNQYNEMILALPCRRLARFHLWATRFPHSIDYRIL